MKPFVCFIGKHPWRYFTSTQPVPRREVFYTTDLSRKCVFCKKIQQAVITEDHDPVAEKKWVKASH